ncbi:MAG TPA: hemerythrin domain-containing protein [Elusimicrobiota bacterium]|nr:hemerythrin domain-containing protein [Elusimicrobiota bacterium]
MNGIASFLSADHDRLGALKSRSASDPKAYAAFRRGLLKHIAMEETILLPAVKRLRGTPLALAKQVRLGHSAITALLTPTPTPAIRAAMRAILKVHNKLEEDDGGIYAQCEQVLGDEVPKVLEALKAAPDVPPAPHSDSPKALAAVNRALEAAGYPPLP